MKSKRILDNLRNKLDKFEEKHNLEYNCGVLFVPGGFTVGAWQGDPNEKEDGSPDYFGKIFYYPIFIGLDFGKSLIWYNLIDAGFKYLS